MESNPSDSSDEIYLDVDAWPMGIDDAEKRALARLDPGLRAVLALAEAGDTHQLYRRLGLGSVADAPKIVDHLPLLIQFDWKGASAAEARQWLAELGRAKGIDLTIDEAFFSDGAPTHVTARLWVDLALDEGRRDASAGEALKRIAVLLAEDRVVRVELPGAAQPFNQSAQDDIGLPPRRGSRSGGRSPAPAAPSGNGVVIGIIDDGCALAHPSFVYEDQSAGTLKSRIRSLWDQGRPAATPGVWTPAPGFSHGARITREAIEAALNDPSLRRHGLVDEDKVYAHLGIDALDLATHGTHVMDIAAGNGRGLLSTPGVAPDAEIVFVQLPRAAVRGGGFALDAAIVEGIRYILNEAGGSPAVINISYGGYIGPHDGTGFVESALDAALAAKPNRAAVVAAGNGFAADCHAAGRLPAGRSRSLGWIVKPEDPTENTLEIWYDGHNAPAELELTLVTPGGTRLGPVGPTTGPQPIIKKGTDLLGTFDHQQGVAPSGSNRIRIILNPTGRGAGGAPLALAPPGEWKVEVKNVGPTRVHFDAWIERDVTGGRGQARRTQSRFHPDDVACLGTLSSYATGELAISAGAYNATTRQVSRYSACGPTRDGRQKPEVLAPAETNAAGRGVLSASARSALPRRMSGTSAAAPVVAGMIALLFEATATKASPLSAADVRELLCDGAAGAPPSARKLQPNAYIAADARRKCKQGSPAVWSELIGSGKVDWPETETRL